MNRTPIKTIHSNIDPCPPKVIAKLANICRFQKFPLFFVSDFIKYQDNKNWIYKGKKIKRPIGVFVKWSKARRDRLINAGLWHGEKIENWDLTAAVLSGYAKAVNPDNEKYIDHLLELVALGSPMSDKEKAHAEQMGMFKELNDLNELEELDKQINSKDIEYRMELICKKCHYKDISTYGIMLAPNEEMDMFCPICNKVERFIFSKLLEQGYHIRED